MCGIAGLVNFKKDITTDKVILQAMIKTLVDRGPDQEGMFISKNVMFGHRRLIVVDPKGGIQPMTKVFENKKYILIYNGELYNTEIGRASCRERV